MPKPRFKPYALTELFGRKSYLRRAGWFESYKRREPVDAEGRPLPLFTYPMIELLARRLPADAAVFEYGSGSSTLWWAERARRVVAVEHHPGWYEHVRSRAPAKVELEFARLEPEGDYSRRILERDERFDLAVVDGRKRVRCARNAASALTERGVLVWDDTSRERYAEGLAELRAQGFRQLELVGMNPTSARRKETSLLYRDGNLLGL